MWHEWSEGRGLQDAGFWWKNTKDRGYLGDLGVNGRKILTL